jgi:nitroreductase
MATQNLLLASHAEGLAACWMCAPLFCPDVVRASLDVPAQWQPQGLITLGYAAEPGRNRPRKPVRAFVEYMTELGPGGNAANGLASNRSPVR